MIRILLSCSHYTLNSSIFSTEFCKYKITCEFTFIWVVIISKNKKHFAEGLKTLHKVCKISMQIKLDETFQVDYLTTCIHRLTFDFRHSQYVCTGGVSAMGSPYHECLGKAAPLGWIDHDQLLKIANRQAPLRACFIRHKPSPNSSFTYPSVSPQKRSKGQVSRK